MQNPPAPPAWWEDPELALAVAEVEQFVASAGWDQAPQMFALVRTDDLVAAGGLPASDDHGAFTAIAQDALPESDGDLSAALASISWPAEVAGCVLAQEIVVLPPGSDAGEGDPVTTAEQAAAHPQRREARLVAGVLRGTTGGACLLRVRDEPDVEPMRGADLAPNLLDALQATFDAD